MSLPADCNNFDWDSGNSPDINFASPMFRPDQPESPIVINFDHERAIIGKFYLFHWSCKIIANEYGVYHFYSKWTIMGVNADEKSN